MINNIKDHVAHEVINYIEHPPLKLNVISEITVAKFLGGGVTAGFPLLCDLSIIIENFGIYIDYLGTMTFSESDDIEYEISFMNDHIHSDGEHRITRKEFSDQLEKIEKTLHDIDFCKCPSNHKMDIIVEFLHINIHSKIVSSYKKYFLQICNVNIPLENNEMEVRNMCTLLFEKLKTIYQMAESIKHHRN